MRITDVLVGVSILMWLGVVAAIVLIFMQTSRGQQVKNSRTIIIGDFHQHMCAKLPFQGGDTQLIELVNKKIH